MLRLMRTIGPCVASAFDPQINPRGFRSPVRFEPPVAGSRTIVIRGKLAGRSKGQYFLLSLQNSREPTN